MTDSDDGRGVDRARAGSEPPGVYGEPARWFDRVRRLLEEQRALCEGLDSLSERQSQTVASGDTDGLLGVLGERQTVIDRIGRINEELAPFRRDWALLLSSVGEARRRELDAIVEDVTASVERVRRRDERDRALLERQRDEVSVRMAGLTKGRGAVAAYGNQGGRPAPAFQDRRG